MAVETHVRGISGEATTSRGHLERHAHWLLRAAIALVFLYHGCYKFIGSGIVAFALELGLPPTVAALVAGIEILAGTAVVVGALVGGAFGDFVSRLAGIAVVPVMIGAIAMVHWGQWHFAATNSHPMGGMEFPVVLLLLGGYFAARGNQA